MNENDYQKARADIFRDQARSRDRRALSVLKAELEALKAQLGPEEVKETSVEMTARTRDRERLLALQQELRSEEKQFSPGRLATERRLWRLRQHQDIEEHAKQSREDVQSELAYLRERIETVKEEIKEEEEKLMKQNGLNKNLIVQQKDKNSEIPKGLSCDSTGNAVNEELKEIIEKKSENYFFTPYLPLNVYMDDTTSAVDLISSSIIKSKAKKEELNQIDLLKSDFECSHCEVNFDLSESTGTSPEAASLVVRPARPSCFIPNVCVDSHALVELYKTPFRESKIGFNHAKRMERVFKKHVSDVRQTSPYDTLLQYEPLKETICRQKSIKELDGITTATCNEEFDEHRSINSTHEKSLHGEEQSNNKKERETCSNKERGGEIALYRSVEKGPLVSVVDVRDPLLYVPNAYEDHVIATEAHRRLVEASYCPNGTGYLADSQRVQSPHCISDVTNITDSSFKFDEYAGVYVDDLPEDPLIDVIVRSPVAVRGKRSFIVKSRLSAPLKYVHASILALYAEERKAAALAQLSPTLNKNLKEYLADRALRHQKEELTPLPLWARKVALLCNNSNTEKTYDSDSQNMVTTAFGDKFAFGGESKQTEDQKGKILATSYNETVKEVTDSSFLGLALGGCLTLHIFDEGGAFDQCGPPLDLTKSFADLGYRFPPVVCVRGYKSEYYITVAMPQNTKASSPTTASYQPRYLCQWKHNMTISDVVADIQKHISPFDLRLVRASIPKRQLQTSEDTLQTCASSLYRELTSETSRIVSAAAHAYDPDGSYGDLVQGRFTVDAQNALGEQDSMCDKRLRGERVFLPIHNCVDFKIYDLLPTEDLKEYCELRIKIFRTENKGEICHDNSFDEELTHVPQKVKDNSTSLESLGFISSHSEAISIRFFRTLHGEIYYFDFINVPSRTTTNEICFIASRVSAHVLRVIRKEYERLYYNQKMTGVPAAAASTLADLDLSGVVNAFEHFPSLKQFYRNLTFSFNGNERPAIDDLECENVLSSENHKVKAVTGFYAQSVPAVVVAERVANFLKLCWDDEDEEATPGGTLRLFYHGQINDEFDVRKYLLSFSPTMKYVSECRKPNIVREVNCTFHALDYALLPGTEVLVEFFDPFFSRWSSEPRPLRQPTPTLPPIKRDNLYHLQNLTKDKLNSQKLGFLEFDTEISTNNNAAGLLTIRNEINNHIVRVPVCGSNTIDDILWTLFCISGCLPMFTELVYQNNTTLKVEKKLEHLNKTLNELKVPLTATLVARHCERKWLVNAIHEWGGGGVKKIREEEEKKENNRISFSSFSGYPRSGLNCRHRGLRSRAQMEVDLQKA